MKKHRVLIFGLIIVILATFSVQVFAQSSDEQTEKARICCQKAGEYIKEDKWGAALEEAKKAIQADPNYPGGHLLLGVIYVNRGELDLAEENLKKTVELDPEIPDSYTYLGRVYYYREKLDKALEYYQKAISKGTAEVIAYQDMGHIYYQKSREIINSGGSENDASGKMSLAIDSYKKAIEIKPDDSELHNALGAAYYSMGKSGNALGEYNKAIELDENNASAYSNLGEYYLNIKGDFPQAIESYKKAIKLYSQEISTASLSQKDMDAKKLEKSLCHYGLGTIYNFQGKADPAIEQFNEVMNLSPDNLMAYVGLASSYELKGDKTNTVKYFEKALEIATAQNNMQFKAAIEDKLKRIETEGLKTN